MKKMRLKDLLIRFNSVNQEIRVIEEQPNGHSQIICEHATVGELLKMESLARRIVSSWDTFTVGNPYTRDNQLNIYVYPEGIKNQNALWVFYMKKYLKLLAKGTITLEGEDVQCAAYDQPNIGYGNIWFVYTKPGSKKEKIFHYRGDDEKALALVEQLKKSAPKENTTK